MIRTQTITVDYILTSNYGWVSLDKMIEDFLNSQPMEVVSIQYSSVVINDDPSFGYVKQCYERKSAMIVYKPLES